VTEYVAWLGLDRRSIDEKDVLSGGIERLNLASAGSLSKAEGATTQVTPILLTSPQAMQIAADKFTGAPDPVGLLRAYKPEGKPLMLAARIAGTANSAYPDGVPKPVKTEADDKSKQEGAKPEGAKPDEAKPDAAKEAKPKDDKADAAKPQKTSGGSRLHEHVFEAVERLEAPTGAEHDRLERQVDELAADRRLLLDP
jgi:hypothetical protein